MSTGRPGGEGQEVQTSRFTFSSCRISQQVLSATIIIMEKNNNGAMAVLVWASAVDSHGSLERGSMMMISERVFIWCPTRLPRNRMYRDSPSAATVYGSMQPLYSIAQEANWKQITWIMNATGGERRKESLQTFSHTCRRSKGCLKRIRMFPLASITGGPFGLKSATPGDLAAGPDPL